MTFGAIISDNPWSYGQFRSSANGAAEAAMTTQSLREMCRVRAGHRWASPMGCVLFLWGTGPKMDEAIYVEKAWGFTHKTMFPWLKTAPTKAQLQAGGIGIWCEAKAEYMLVATRGDVGGFYTVSQPKEDGKRAFNRLRPRPPGVLVGPREYPVFWDARVESDPDFWNGLTASALLAEAARKKKGEVNHSKKPLALYDYIETFPGSILELYARKEPVASFDEERRARWTCWGYDLGYELGSWGVRKKNGGLF